MAFGNAIFGKAGELIRTAIKSANDTWSLSKDGTMIAKEFHTGDPDTNAARVSISDAAGGDVEFFSAGETDYSGKLSAFETSGGHAMRLEGADVHATRSPALIVLEGKASGSFPALTLYGEDNNDHFLRLLTDIVEIIGGNVIRLRVDHDEVQVNGGTELACYGATDFANKCGRMRGTVQGTREWFVFEGEDQHPSDGRPRVLLISSDQSGDEVAAVMGLEGSAEVKAIQGELHFLAAKLFGSSTISTSSTAGQALHYNTSTGEIFRHTP